MSETVQYDVELGDLETALEDRDICGDEKLKLENTMLGGEKLRQELEDASKPDVDKTVHINLKSHGIYIQFDRVLVKEGKKVWSFMVRTSVWGGGDISPDAWLKYSELAEKYSTYDDGSPSLRLTTRQTFQFHRVTKDNLLPLVHGIIATGRMTLNGCGDNTRNPIASVVKSDIFDANALAQKIGKYFQLPVEEHFSVFNPPKEITEEQKQPGFNYHKMGLPRKFKIGIEGIYEDQDQGLRSRDNKEKSESEIKILPAGRHGKNEIEKNSALYTLHYTLVRDNSADILTNDAGVSPVIENGKLTGYQVYIGGGLGQKNRKVTFAALGRPFGVFKTEEDLIIGLDAIVQVQQQVGDRKNRHFARLKNVLIKKGLEATGKIIEEILFDTEQFKQVQDAGIEWYKKQVEKLGIKVLPPVKIKLGEVIKHEGWLKQPDGNYSFGLWIENGRLADTNPQGKVKSLVDEIVKTIRPNVRIQPSQDLFFTDIREDLKEVFESILKKYNYGNYSTLMKKSIACVGLYTCPLAVAQSEKYFYPLITELENEGFGELEGVTIGISGCERHCPRNVRNEISIEGKADNIYQLKLMFGVGDGDNLATDLICDDKKFLRYIPQEYVPELLKTLLKNYEKNRFPEENNIAEFHKRIGTSAILDLISQNENLKVLLEKTADVYVA